MTLGRRLFLGQRLVLALQTHYEADLKLRDVLIRPVRDPEPGHVQVARKAVHSDPYDRGIGADKILVFALVKALAKMTKHDQAVIDMCAPPLISSGLDPVQTTGLEAHPLDKPLSGTESSCWYARRIGLHGIGWVVRIYRQMLTTVHRGLSAGAESVRLSASIRQRLRITATRLEMHHGGLDAGSSLEKKNTGSC